MRLRFVLPPGWVGFPLGDPAGCEREVGRVVKALPLDDGTGARLRRELRDDLLHQCTRARDGGASYLAVAGPRSAPLSGSLLVTPLRRTLPAGSPEWDDVVGADARTFRLAVGQVTRAVRHRPADKTGAGDDLPTLAVDYWVTTAEGRQLQVACSTPLVAHEEAMVQLFDAVIGSAEVDG